MTNPEWPVEPEHWFGNLFRMLCVRPLVSYRKWRCRRAKEYLLRHDPTYRRHAAERELVRRRDDARERGIGPADAAYPDLAATRQELPPAPWLRRKSWF